MSISISELYGKRIITSAGSVLGTVQGVVMDFEKGVVSHLLLRKIEDLSRSGDIRNDFRKSSVSYERVSKVGETIIVQAQPVPKSESE
jgi:sporulation protein YlmC with PRC-barrel domain